MVLDLVLVDLSREGGAVVECCSSVSRNPKLLVACMAVSRSRPTTYR